MNRRDFFGTVAGAAVAAGLDYSVMPALPAAEPEPVAKPAASGFTVIAENEHGHVVIGLGSVDSALRSGSVFGVGCILINPDGSLYVNETFRPAAADAHFSLIPAE